jgi:hypothetical protein
MIRENPISFSRILFQIEIDLIIDWHVLYAKQLEIYFFVKLSLIAGLDFRYSHEALFVLQELVLVFELLRIPLKPYNMIIYKTEIAYYFFLIA